MQDLQEVFNRIQKNKEKLKDLKGAFTEALKSSESYVEAAEAVKVVKEKQKRIEKELKQHFSGEFTQMEDLKIDIASDQEVLNDIAITMVMKGEGVSIVDKYENEYEPLFKINFKKVK